MKTNKLLTCPFCGGVVTEQMFNAGAHYGYISEYIYISCCGIEMRETYDSGRDTLESARFALYNRWNTRARPLTVKQELADEAFRLLHILDANRTDNYKTGFFLDMVHELLHNLDLKEKAHNENISS